MEHPQHTHPNHTPKLVSLRNSRRVPKMGIHAKAMNDAKNEAL
jgi:hypothetical protein